MLSLPITSYGKIIKGGPGSGNHDHAGIPGDQGGSQPKGLTTVAAGEALTLTQENKQHPLLKLFTGNVPDITEDGKLLVSAERQAALKLRAAESLSSALGITKQHANGFIKIWADSSNDHSLQSLGIQQAAANEFDTFITYWQQDRLKETLQDAKAAFAKGFEQRLAKGMDGGKAAFETINNLKAEYVYPFQIKAAKELVAAGESPKTTEEALALFDRAGEMGIQTTQKALRTIQEDTTAMLKANGITSIRAYRGFQMEGEPPAHWSPGSTVNIRNNALSSWTLNKDAAEKYSNVKNGVLLEAEIPIDRVISLPHTGIGNSGQWEVVMLGDKQRDKALVLSHGKDIAIEAEPAKPQAKPKAAAEPKPVITLQPGQNVPEMRKLSAPSNGLSTFTATTKYRKHPYVAAYAGDRPEFLKEHLMVSAKRVEALKQQVSQALARDLDVEPAEVNTMLHAWATNSNGEMTSMAIQQAAAQEFSIDLSPWQQTQYKELFAAKKAFFQERLLANRKGGGSDLSAIEQTFYDMTPTGFFDLFPFQGSAIKQAALSGDVPTTAAEADAFFERTAETALTKTRAALRWIHTQTQAQFKEWGIETVRASRGFTATREQADNWKEGDTVHYAMNALSSWSLSRTRSDFFSGDSRDAVQLESAIPVSRILSMPMTGLGSAYEWEIVVVGSDQSDTAEVIYRNQGVKMLIKGGVGSGNHHHLGIEGHRGGSLPQGMGGGSAASAVSLPTFNTIGHSSVSAAVAGGLRPTVNLDNSAHVHSALDKFIQGSPSLSRAATSKTPLPTSFMTPPAGGKQGDQHLGEIMRATGVDSKLPTKQNLQIGAKSMYMPISGKDELDAYMEQRLAEKGPRMASSGGGAGVFKPHPAKGANAHAQLKPDAKVADKKKVEQARQKVRQETHGLLMSALVDAAKTGDYSQANALEVKYQLTGGTETFALLMGYQAVDGGMESGTVVLDRSALNIHPTPVLGTHRPSDNQTNYPMPTPPPPRSSIDKTYPHKAQVVKSIGEQGKVVKGLQIGKLFSN